MTNVRPPHAFTSQAIDDLLRQLLDGEAKSDGTGMNLWEQGVRLPMLWFAEALRRDAASVLIIPLMYLHSMKHGRWMQVTNEQWARFTNLERKTAGKHLSRLIECGLVEEWKGGRKRSGAGRYIRVVGTKVPALKEHERRFRSEIETTKLVIPTPTKRSLTRRRRGTKPS